MKVALNVLSQSPGHSTGALSWFLQFARIAPRRDPESEYLLIVGRPDLAFYHSKNLVARIAGMGWGNSRRALRVLSEHFLLAGTLEREKADILFQGGSGVAPLFLPRRVKLVLAVWGMQHVTAGNITPERRIYRRLLFRPGLRRADLIIVNSVYTRDLLLAHYCSDIRAPIEVVHHGVDLSLFRPGPLQDEERDSLAGMGVTGPYILFVGQIYPYKLLHILAQAFCRAISRSGLPHKLVVVGSFARSDSMGDDYRRQIEQTLKDTGLEDRLVLVQDIGVRELRELYVGADLYVQSSAGETFGRTVLEAMACGTPVLAARAAATPEILSDAGWYYESLDAEECTRGILAILQDTNLRQELSSRGLRRARDFCFDGEVDRLVALCHRVHLG